MHLLCQRVNLWSHFHSSSYFISLTQITNSRSLTCFSFITSCMAANNYSTIHMRLHRRYSLYTYIKQSAILYLQKKRKTLFISYILFPPPPSNQLAALVLSLAVFVKQHVEFAYCVLMHSWQLLRPRFEYKGRPPLCYCHSISHSADQLLFCRCLPSLIPVHFYYESQQACNCVAN